MIDRKALLIAVLIILSMVAINVWCLNLLPEWHTRVTGYGDGHTVKGFRLFFFPFAVFLMVATRVSRKWFLSGSDEAVRPWQTFSTKYFVRILVLIAALYAFAVARELGYTQPWDPLTVSRFSAVAFGLLIMAMGNAVPKLPWLYARISLFRLDPWQWNRYARLLGKLRVGTGVALIIGSLLLPPKMFAPSFLAVLLTGMMAMVWYRIKLRREPKVPL